MSSTWKNNISFTVFGESHGPAIGVCMDNVPPGESIDVDKIYKFMARRAPKKDGTTTAADSTTAAALAMIFIVKIPFVIKYPLNQSLV